MRGRPGLTIQSYSLPENIDYRVKGEHEHKVLRSGGVSCLYPASTLQQNFEDNMQSNLPPVYLSLPHFVTNSYNKLMIDIWKPS